MTWKFWKKADKPEEAKQPDSLGGPTKLGGYSGPAPKPGAPPAVPPKTTGTCSPAPMRPVAGGGFHGGEIPALEGLEPYTEAWRAKLQGLLPRGTVGPKPPVQVSFIEPAPDDIPSRDYMALAVQGKDPRRQDLKDFTYGQIALQIAGLGTCCRLKVGCVLLTKEGRVAGMGYNGAGPGMPHCNENHCNENCRCVRTLHAEQNALSSRNAAPYTAFVTHEPCLGCTKELLIAGVRRVRYLKPYTSMPPAETTARAEWIEHYGVDWQQQTPQPFYLQPSSGAN